jgi:hypothetical protein
MYQNGNRANRSLMMVDRASGSQFQLDEIISPAKSSPLIETFNKKSQRVTPYA